MSVEEKQKDLKETINLILNLAKWVILVHLI